MTVDLSEWSGICKATASPASIYENPNNSAQLIDHGDDGVIVIFKIGANEAIHTESFFNSLESCRAYVEREKEKQRQRVKSLEPYR